MKRNTTTLLIACLLAIAAGCATHTTIQTDKRYDADTGKLVGEITTETKARTFWEADTRLSNFKVSQTEKTQGVAVGEYSGNSHAATNTGSMIQDVTELVKEIKGVK